MKSKHDMEKVIISARPLSPDVFPFLRELSENNNKAWFAENKSRFVATIQQPMIHFIETMAPWLDENAPAFLADTRLNGGSLFRIYRDTRFSADKSPYKTNIGCHFRHCVGKDAHAPGFYVHIARNDIFFGGGIWMPPTPVLHKIRAFIVENPERWQTIVSDRSFHDVLGGLGSCAMLKRPPRGYPVDHPFVADLKRKSFYAFASCNEEEVCKSDFQTKVQTAFVAILPLMKFLTEALDLSWQCQG